MNTYKAGDFTSGKMGEIFKNCFRDDYVTITHKQFGVMYLVDEEIIKTMAISKLQRSKSFEKYQKLCTGWKEGCKFSPSRMFGILDAEAQMHYIEDFFEDEFCNWFEVLQVA